MAYPGKLRKTLWFLEGFVTDIGVMSTTWPGKRDRKEHSVESHSWSRQDSVMSTRKPSRPRHRAPRQRVKGLIQEGHLNPTVVAIGLIKSAFLERFF